MGSGTATLEAPKKTAPLAKFILAALSVFVLLVFLVGLAGNLDKPRTVAGNTSKPALSTLQIKELAEQIPYAELARNPTRYVGRLVYFRGKVIQTLERGQDVTLRISVTQGTHGFWTDVLLVTYRRSYSSEPRVLENDIVELWGTYGGIVSYESIFRQMIQIPYVAADIVELNSPGAIVRDKDAL